MAPPEEAAVLSRADWERIQSSLNQPEAKVYTRQHVIESNALNLIFRTEDKLLKARCRKLQATKKLEQQAKEAHLNMLAAEEVELKKQDWQQAVDEANIKRFHQNDWVRKYNSGLLTTHVQKENEAVMKYNREKQRTAEERKRQYEEEMRSRENKALRQEQDKARQRQLYNQAVADHHIEQMKANKQLREEERQQEKEERDRLRGLDELHAQELRHQAEIKAESKKSCLKYHLEAISSADLNREREAQKLKTEEEERKRVRLDIEGKQKQRKNDQAAKFRVSNVTLKTENRAILDQLKKEEQDAAEKNAEQIGDRDKQLQQYVQCELHEAADSRRNVPHLLAASTGVIFDGEEPVYYCKNADEKMPRFATDQTCFKKRDLERINMVDLPPLSRAAKLKSKDALAVKEVVAGQRSSTVGVEGSQYRSKDTSESSASMCTAQTQSMKKYLDRNKLQLSHEETSEVDLKPSCPPSISNKDKLRSKDTLAYRKATTGQYSPAAEVEGSHCRAKGRGESLLRLGTDQTRSTKQYLKLNKLQLVYEEAGKVDQKLTHLPPISNTIKLKSTDTLASKEKTGGRGPTVAVEGSHYLSKNTGYLFPRFATERSRSTKQYLKQNKLQLTYKENSRIDQQPTHLPPISTKEAPAGRRCPPARCGGFPLLF
ncbi:zinc finger CCCH domain-containing protein 13-like [Siniperca chuatsi]|uniref:zinc finger CCCH domain-containing protein 13-like n=1 Tax=Siniperca chuatsi TaxID=119488 RepID=UPI001CE12FA3|nr:zinc finger CCCH domain-containing protein 13-like [Siniperca chuatsi]